MTQRASVLASVGLAAAIVSSLVPAWAGPRQAVPHGGGGAMPRASAPSHTMSTATRGGPPRGHVPPRGTANGTAHYGYTHGGVGGYPGYGYGGCYPYWGWGGYWGWGWSGWWGWPGYAYYPPYYGYYGYAPDLPGPSYGPAPIETDVTPGKTEVLLDGSSVGFAKDYDGRWDTLPVASGHHVIEFRKDGYRSLIVEIDARPGAHYRFDDVLVAGEGEDRRSLAPPPPA